MPETTSIAKFLRAVKSGQTDITKTLTNRFKKPKKLAGKPEFNNLKNPNALKSGNQNDWKDELKPFMEKHLKNHKPMEPGVEPDAIVLKILDHIENWPNDPGGGLKGKEQLRQVLVAVIKAADANPATHSHPVKFFWKLNDDIEEENIEIKGKKPDDSVVDVPISDDPDFAGGINTLKDNEPIKVTFINPWSKVRDENIENDQIEVSIGPEE